jgi:hypothetical protein
MVYVIRVVVVVVIVVVVVVTVVVVYVVVTVVVIYVVVVVYVMLDDPSTIKSGTDKAVVLYARSDHEFQHPTSLECQLAIVS